MSCRSGEVPRAEGDRRPENLDHVHPPGAAVGAALLPPHRLRALRPRPPRSAPPAPAPGGASCPSRARQRATTSPDGSSPAGRSGGCARSPREHVEQEAADELAGLELIRRMRFSVRVVLPGEGDLRLGDGEQTGVGDGDAVRVAGEVLQRRLCAPEGRLGVDDPAT